jgi:hypothetical protein
MRPRRPTGDDTTAALRHYRVSPQAPIASNSRAEYGVCLSCESAVAVLTGSGHYRRRPSPIRLRHGWRAPYAAVSGGEIH